MTEDLKARLKARLKVHLKENETFLWTGKPKPGILLNPSELIMIPMSLVVGIGSFLLLISLIFF